MQIKLTGQHLEITEALKSCVDSKLAKLERHFDHITSAHVVLSVEKLRKKAEGTIHVSGASLVADAVHEDMYAAIDALSDKLDRQIRKHKEKLTDHHRDRSTVRDPSLGPQDTESGT